VTRLLTLVVVLVGLVAAGPALAFPPAQRGEAFNRIEKQAMCIECNVPLNIAVSPQADATRVEIRRLLGLGLDDKQVLDSLVKTYGPNILATPKARGFNVLAFAVPIAALALLLVLGLVLLPRWKRNRAAAGEPGAAEEEPSHASRAEQERLDAELARYGA
jgi:cytochrome c-type biogenesis protein CcmH/NrfF